MKTRIMQKNIEQSVVWRSLKEQRLVEWIRVMDDRIERAKHKRFFIRSKYKKEFTNMEMKQAKIIMKKLIALNKLQKEQLQKVAVAFWIFFLYTQVAASGMIDHIFCIKMRSFNEQALKHRLKTMQNIAYAYVFKIKAQRNGVGHTPYATMMILDH